MSDKELIELLCKDEIFRNSIEEAEKDKLLHIEPDWEENRLCFYFEENDPIYYNLSNIIKKLRKENYEKEYLQ